MRTRLPAIAAALLTTSLSAQSTPALEQLLDRMGAYLIEYETQLSSIVAEERFEQSAYARRQMSQHARLESEVAFMRLPGGAEWLGFRDVRRVNWKPVATKGPSMLDVLGSPGGDIFRALAIANASARHNLGLPRTINVPTAPLDIVHPRNHQAHEFALAGTASVGGRHTMIISFQEVTRPTLVREPNGRNLVSNGRVWVEPASGVVRRIEWHYRPEGPLEGAVPRLRVDFTFHRGLGIMVPDEMEERFSVSGGRGQGRATYRNFRRFGTSARIITPPS